MKIYIDMTGCMADDATQEMHYWRQFWKEYAQQHTNDHFIWIADKAIPDLQQSVNIEIIVYGHSSFFQNKKKLPRTTRKLIQTGDVWISFQPNHLIKKQKQILYFNDRSYTNLVAHVKTGKRIQRASQIISISNWHQQQLMQRVKQMNANITLIPPVPFAHSLTWEEKEVIKKQYTDGRDYFVFAGGIGDQYALMSLLKAYSVFRKWQQSSMKLLLCGYTTQHTATLQTALQTYKYRDDVHMVLNPSSGAMQSLIATAYACVHPAVTPSYPYTILQAMLNEVPVIAADTPVIRELAGDAVLYVKADDKDAIAKEMILLYKDEAVRRSLINKGRENKILGWNDMMQLWADVINKS